MMISRVMNMAGQPLGWFLCLTVLIGLTHVGESTAAAPGYEAEIQDLRRLPAQDCLHCVLLEAFDSVIPIPERFSLSVDLHDTDRCVGFTAPADDLLRRALRDPLAKLKERGNLSFCRPEALDREAAKMEKEAPPRQRFTRAGISVTEFEPLKLSNGAVLYRAYLRTDKEALMIHDPNPHLWEAMLEVAAKTRASASAR
jgi:hypothetical protein